MIQRIEIQGFKTFRDVALDLGPFNLLIGANGSGKSNFLDALRFLQGIGYGLTISESLNGKPRSATGEVWEGIRGGSAHVLFRASGQGGSQAGAVRAGLSISSDPPGNRYPPPLSYTCFFEAGTAGQIAEETLDLGGQRMFRYSRSEPGELRVGPADLRANWHHVAPSHPILTWLKPGAGSRVPLTAHVETAIEACTGILANMHHLSPDPAVLRSYSSAATAVRMGPHGEDFAAVVAQIAASPEDKAAFDDWLGRLSPDAIRSAEIVRGALGEAMFAARDAAGTEWLAPTLSDGTLRFAALAAALFQPDPPGLLCLEEIENGIHPTRLRLLLELFRARSGEGRQIVSTTHSPLVLEWLTEEEYAHAFWFHRDDETGETHVIPLSEVPGLIDAVRRRSISELLAEGWLESVL